MPDAVASTELEPSKAGRPSSYHSRFCKPAKALCELGATDQQLAEYFEVCVQTIWAWKNERKEFFNATKLGKDSADYRVERSLYERAVGYSHPQEEIKVVSCGLGESEIVRVPTIKHYPPDPASMIFWLKNRRPKEWRDKIDTTISNSDGTNIMDALALMIAQKIAQGTMKEIQDVAIDVKQVEDVK